MLGYKFCQISLGFSIFSRGCLSWKLPICLLQHLEYVGRGGTWNQGFLQIIYRSEEMIFADKRRMGMHRDHEKIESVVVYSLVIAQIIYKREQILHNNSSLLLCICCLPGARLNALHTLSHLMSLGP